MPSHARVAAGEKSAMTPKMVIGCVLAIAGFCIYSHAKMYAKAAPAQAPAADLEAAQPKVTARSAQSFPRPSLCLPPGCMVTCTDRHASMEAVAQAMHSIFADPLMEGFSFGR